MWAAQPADKKENITREQKVEKTGQFCVFQFQLLGLTFALICLPGKVINYGFDCLLKRKIALPNCERQHRQQH